jgi:hypothetical protein
LPTLASPQRRLVAHARRLSPWRADRRAAAVLSLILIATTFAHAPLRDATTREAATGVRLVLPGVYVPFAPLFDVLDAIAGLSLHAHYALIGWVLVIAVAWPRGVGIDVLRRLARAGVAVVGLAVLYGGCMLLPRPTAHIVATDRDLVVIDFHSHTRASHDGRQSFTVARNRAWHREGGFNVAYITDHESLDGAALGMATNPAHAGDGMVLLPGIELHDGSQHVNVLGARAEESDSYSGGELHAGLLTSQTRRAGITRPLVLFTLPGSLKYLNASQIVDAVELSDGAPRGLDQGDRERQDVLTIADSLDLAVVAGSNNHGWAPSPIAWSVMRIPGWRAMTPATLQAAIQQTIRTRGRHAVMIVERRMPMPGSTRAAHLAQAPLATAFGSFSALTWAERLSWLSWIWAIQIGRLTVRDRLRRRRASRAALPS